MQRQPVRTVALCSLIFAFSFLGSLGVRFLGTIAAKTRSRQDPAADYTNHLSLVTHTFAESGGKSLDYQYTSSAAPPPIAQ